METVGYRQGRNIINDQKCVGNPSIIKSKLEQTEVEKLSQIFSREAWYRMSSCVGELYS